ncbi:MAG TPA: ABC transporter substrate-binding protein [Sedimenticola sp.]|nr:ABC transporter substrate-binding protein [Sedimenticola sp.]
MNKRLSTVLVILFLSGIALVTGGTSPAVAGITAAKEDPYALVKQTADRVLAEIASRKEELTRNPGRIYGLVDDIVLPRFDFYRMSRLVLGRYWRRATDPERAAFVREFRELLVRTYATALLSYSGQKIEYLPGHVAPGARRVKVNTQVREPGAPPIPIDYSLYLDDKGEWKVYDVSIDGVSLVSNYRSSFSSQIRRYKLSGLIQRLAERNRKSRDGNG